MSPLHSPAIQRGVKGRSEELPQARWEPHLLTGLLWLRNAVCACVGRLLVLFVSGPQLPTGSCCGVPEYAGRGGWCHSQLFIRRVPQKVRLVFFVRSGHSNKVRNS